MHWPSALALLLCWWGQASRPQEKPINLPGLECGAGRQEGLRTVMDAGRTTGQKAGGGPRRGCVRSQVSVGAWLRLIPRGW